MDAILLFQLCDKNLGVLESYGVVDFEKAVSFFNDFSWENQNRKIEIRKGLKLTSSTPEIILKRERLNDSLTIRYVSENVFELVYECNKRYSTDLVPLEEVLDNTREVVKVIDMFFKGNLEAHEEHLAFDEDNKEKRVGEYDARKYLFHAWALLIPVVVSFLWYLMNSGEDNVISVFALTLGAVLLYYSGFLYLYLQYVSNPRINYVDLFPQTNSIRVYFQEKEKEISRDDVIQCVYSFSSDGKLPGNSFANLVVSLNDNTQHIFTSLSFSHSDLKSILNVLNVNYYIFDGFQMVRTKIFKINPDLNPVYNADKDKLKDLYTHYSSERLKEIVANAEEYQADAVEIARKELASRQ